MKLTIESIRMAIAMNNKILKYYPHPIIFKCDSKEKCCSLEFSLIMTKSKSKFTAISMLQPFKSRLVEIYSIKYRNKTCAQVQ